jgi:hypothetical protein
VEACGHGSWFGYKWDDCERCSVFVTGVTPVSLWPLITIGNLGVIMLKCGLGLDAFSAIKSCC